MADMHPVDLAPVVQTDMQISIHMCNHTRGPTSDVAALLIDALVTDGCHWKMFDWYRFLCGNPVWPDKHLVTITYDKKFSYDAYLPMI